MMFHCSARNVGHMSTVQYGPGAFCLWQYLPFGLVPYHCGSSVELETSPDPCDFNVTLKCTRKRTVRYVTRVFGCSAVRLSQPACDCESCCEQTSARERHCVVECWKAAHLPLRPPFLLLRCTSPQTEFIHC